MTNHWVRTLGRSAGSVILVTGSVLLPVGAASAAPLQNYQVDVVVAPTLQEQDRRLDNGHFVRAGSRTGRGELTIDNGSDHDAVVTLAINKNPAFSVYVRKGSKYTVKGIRDDTYQVFFTTGADWDTQNRAFTRDHTFQRFDDTLTFTTIKTATEVQWSTWTITLHSVIGGTANTHEVNPNDFPAL